MISDQEIRNLVIERLKTLPQQTGISIGSMGDFGKDELIQHVEQNDEIGKKIVEAELNFLRSLKEGLLYDWSTSDSIRCSSIHRI